MVWDLVRVVATLKEQCIDDEFPAAELIENV
jgi:hypothetical protein